MLKKARYQTRRAIEEDRAWLERLRREVYRELFVATFGGWDDDLHLVHFEDSWKQGSISIIEIDGMDVGMIQVIDEPGALRVREIQIRPQDQNKGLGTEVLRDVIRDARKQAKSVRLRVGLKNPRALRFYERSGFKKEYRSATHFHMRVE